MMIIINHILSQRQLARVKRGIRDGPAMTPALVFTPNALMVIDVIQINDIYQH